MLISPPFLPAARAGESDTEWIARAMPVPIDCAIGTYAPEGSFPVSSYMQWHNGVHCTAPHEDGQHLPVRAVADGTVVFVAPPVPANKDAAHPQNYPPQAQNRFGWTDNGCVAIRHTTDIGAFGGVPTRITYFSLSMHLRTIADGQPDGKGKAMPWKVGDRIYRKDAIGEPGQIMGVEGRLHFEICCDETNLEKIIGRPARWEEDEKFAVPKADGRTDAVFGSVFIRLPDTTPTHATEPTDPVRKATGAQPLGAEQWVEIRYDKGRSYISCRDALGKPIGTPPAVQLEVADFEYDMYELAGDRHAAYLAKGGLLKSSPSGWYELLRFGRNLGPDPLPVDAAHWRQIPTAKGNVWADLNAVGTFKFSEADFLPVMGWNCFGDDPNPNDQRCDSIELKRLIRDRDPENETRMTREALCKRIAKDFVREKLRKVICKFPMEWDRAMVAKRYSWIREPKEDFGMDDQGNWDRFMRHCDATTFSDLPDELKKANWRFHPVEFIGVMRRCGWLSKQEIVQNFSGDKTKSVDAASILLDMPILERSGRLMRPALLYPALSLTMRKYGINTYLRMAHWFSQTMHESGLFKSMREYGNDAYLNNYYEGRCRSPIKRVIKGISATLTPLGNCAVGDGVRYSGKGLIQLTGGDNYRKYEKYRNNGDFTNDPNPERLASEAMTACDVAGAYWVSKQRFNLQGGKLIKKGSLSINYWAELVHVAKIPGESDLASLMADVTKCINSNLEGQEERIELFKNSFMHLSDQI